MKTDAGAFSFFDFSSLPRSERAFSISKSPLNAGLDTPASFLSVNEGSDTWRGSREDFPWSTIK